VRATLHPAAGSEHDAAFRVVVLNTGKGISFLTRLRLVTGKEHAEILPVFWEDNYISLLPGERREVSVRVRKSDLLAAKPSLIVDGFNLAQFTAAEGAR
jgi:hypothetical protein